MKISVFAVGLVSACALGFAAPASAAPAGDDASRVSGAFVMETMWAQMNQYLPQVEDEDGDLVASDPFEDGYVSFGSPKLDGGLVAQSFTTVKAAQAAAAHYSFPAPGTTGPITGRSDNGQELCLAVVGVNDPFSNTEDLDWGTVVAQSCTGSVNQAFSWVSEDYFGQQRLALTITGKAYGTGHASLVCDLFDHDLVMLPGAGVSAVITDSLAPVSGIQD